MTPEERAERELRGFWKADAGAAKDERRLLAIFQDTIRDAENDALEEAAKVCEETWVEPGDLQVERCSEAAEAIRALKHEPVD